MKHFIKKTVIFAVFPVMFILVLPFFANGYSDPFYIRFTTPKQKNLILGTSRAAQGLQPKYFEEVLGIKLSNYSFTITDSPFGEIYLKSIKLKHSKEKDGIFIIAVDPWSISIPKIKDDNAEYFIEKKSFMANTTIVDRNPNFSYLYENFSGKYKDILRPPTNKMFVHEDGWLEVKNIKMDSLSVAQRTKRKVGSYKNQKVQLSSIRLKYLLETVKYLKDYGSVYLVRLPIDEDMMSIENDLMSNFDQIIQEVVNNADGYKDLTSLNTNFKYVDGNHLYSMSGAQVSKLIALWIKEIESNSIKN